jgi:hypothetical protein
MPDNAFWTKTDEDALIDYLEALGPTAGDGGNFKSFIWNGASTTLAPLVSRGGPKTANSCKYKWGNVHMSLIAIFVSIQTLHQLKKIYAVIRVTWDDETGTSIDYTTADSWDAYVVQHKDAKPFHNAGWVHLGKVLHIMPSATHGTNVFQASDALTRPGGVRVVGGDRRPHADMSSKRLYSAFSRYMSDP